MPETFDPYRKWLGIPLEEQPPHHYRLLGIGVFEDDPDVIESAADRQMAHVQTRKTGKHTQLTQRLLNELSTAKIHLLDPEKKAAYDKNLRRSLAVRKPASRPRQPAKKALPRAKPLTEAVTDKQPRPSTGPQPANPIVVAGRGTRSGARRRRPPKQGWIMYAGTGGAAAVVIIVAVIVGSQSSVPENDVRIAKRDEGTKRDQITKAPVDSSHKPPAAPAEDNPKQPSPSIEDVRNQDSSTPPDSEPILSAAPGAPVTPDPVTIPDPEIIPNVEPATPEVPSITEPPARVITWKRKPLAARVDLSEVQALLDAAGKDFPADQIVRLAGKSAVPGEQEQTDAINLVHEVYQSDFQAADSAAEKLSLAKKLFSKGTENAEPAESFALLTEARDLAQQSGKIMAAFQIIDAISQLFEVETLYLKADMIEQIAADPTSGQSQQLLAAGAIALVESAVVANDFDLATQLHEVGVAAADKSRNTTLTATGKSVGEELRLLQTRFAQFEIASDTLGEVPTDPAANLIVGQFYCFILGDWETGLPYLAASGDEYLKEAASRELAAPAETAGQLEIGDGWWDLIGSADELGKPAIRAHAAKWYELALEGATGLAKEKVEARLAKLTESPSTPAITELPRFAKDLLGKYVLKETGKKSKQNVFSVCEFDENFQFSRNGQLIGRWTIADGKQIMLTLNDTDDPPIFLRPSKGSIKGARNVAQGEDQRWDLSRLSVVAVWEHTTKKLMIFGRVIPEETERLTFYSNGRVNDPLGGMTWTQRGPNLAIDWGESKTTIAVLTPDGKSYRGETTRPVGFRDITITLIVVGRSI